jgi:hypothetical protein
MDRENSLTLLWPERGMNPIPSDPLSEPLIDCATGSDKKKTTNKQQQQELIIVVPFTVCLFCWLVG